MSTKRLSKTVIEGGRYGHNKYDRRQSHTYVRAEERDYLKAVVADPELADEMEIGQLQPVYQGFSDKLSPMYRWLDAQVGRPWDEVRAEVFQKFDTRTTAGRHITFDHLLKEVVDTESGFDNYGRMSDPEIPVISGNAQRYYSFSDYYVDRQGILQARPDKGRRHSSHWEKVSVEEFKAVSEWLSGRMIMEKGGKYYWLVPTQDIWLASWYDPYGNTSSQWPYGGPSLVYYVWRNGEYKTTTTTTSSYPAWDPNHSYSTTSKSFGDHWEKVENPYSFRQRGELSSDDLKIFQGFKDRIREDILVFGKGR